MGGIEIQCGNMFGRSQGGIGDGQQGVNGSFVCGSELFGVDSYGSF